MSEKNLPVKQKKNRGDRPHRITPEERMQIAAGHIAGRSVREIARKVGRSVSGTWETIRNLDPTEVNALKVRFTEKLGRIADESADAWLETLRAYKNLPPGERNLDMLSRTCGISLDKVVAIAGLASPVQVEVRDPQESVRVLLEACNARVRLSKTVTEEIEVQPGTEKDASTLPTGEVPAALPVSTGGTPTKAGEEGG